MKIFYIPEKCNRHRFGQLSHRENKRNSKNLAKHIKNIKLITRPRFRSKITTEKKSALP